MSDFFESPKEEAKVEPTQEIEKVKVGEAEYTQEELSRLVGLGSVAADLEKNYGKLDKVMSEFGRRADEIGRLRKEVDEFKTKQISMKTENQQQLTQEELKQVAKQQAKELGLMTNEDFDQLYVTRRAAEKLIEDTEGIIEAATSKGQPATTKEALLAHMQETGIRNPEKAYKDMFEKELDEWREKQTQKAAMPGIFSNSGSTAGAKVPPEVKVTRENLEALVHEALLGGGSQ